MRRFRITFDTTEGDLATVVSLLATECSNFNVTELGEVTALPPKSERKQSPLPNQSQASRAIIHWLKTHGNQPTKAKEFGRALMANGCQPRSAHSRLSILLRAGIVTRENNAYQLAPQYYDQWSP